MTQSDWWDDGVFQEWESLPWDTGIHDKNIKEILEQYPVSGSVLELGCGYGNDARWFADNGFDVTAIDISAKAIDMAISKGGDIEYLVEDARTFSSDKKFDLVYDRGYTHNEAIGSNGQNIVRNLFLRIHSLLKSSGKFIILSGNPNAKGSAYPTPCPLYISQVEKSCLDLFNSKLVKEIIFEQNAAFEHSLGWIFVLEKK